jgi:hypothetical protein
VLRHHLALAQIAARPVIRAVCLEGIRAKQRVHARDCRRTHEASCASYAEDAQDFFDASSFRIQLTSFFASASEIATLLGGMARPETLPFQWLS